MKPLLVVIAVLAQLTGCQTYSASRYSILGDNLRTLRALKGQSINVGPFSAATPGQTEIICRGAGPIKTPDGEAFEQFVQKAFLDELTIAELYSVDAPTTITGRLDAIDFSSGIGAAWNIALTITSSNGNSLSVSEEYKYASSFEGDDACKRTAQSLMPAVQNAVLIGRDQVLDGSWLSRLRIARKDFGIGMTNAEVSEVSGQIDIGALREYRDAARRTGKAR